jgi:hypothetical protein
MFLTVKAQTACRARGWAGLTSACSGSARLLARTKKRGFRFSDKMMVGMQGRPLKRSVGRDNVKRYSTMYIYKMQESIVTHLDRFIIEQSSENFSQLRDVVVSSPNYNPYSKEKNKVLSLMEHGKFEESEKLLQLIMPNWILNPGIHKLLSFVLIRTGKERESLFENELSKVILNGILSTGDGNEKHPYCVVRLDDEYDVLQYFGKELHKQRLINKKGKHYDLLECEDRSNIWFDITIPYSYLNIKIM